MIILEKSILYSVNRLSIKSQYFVKSFGSDSIRLGKSVKSSLSLKRSLRCSARWHDKRTLASSWITPQTHARSS